MKRFSISMEEELLKKFDELIARHNYPSRSHAVRELVRDALIEESVKEDSEVFGTITVIYNHEVKDITDRITHLQHGYLNEIRAAIHVHVDEKNCLETLIVHGRASIIRKIASGLEGIKGVKHVKFIMTSVEP